MTRNCIYSPKCKCYNPRAVTCGSSDAQGSYCGRYNQLRGLENKEVLGIIFGDVLIYEGEQEDISEVDSDECTGRGAVVRLAGRFSDWLMAGF